jgi:serine/threonine protein kinase
MEYLDGCTLSDVLHEENRLPVYWVVDILEQVCSAVHEAHQQGVVHRDLKPDNIWLEPNGLGGYRVKVLDFGIAKLGEAAPLDSEFIPPVRIDEDVATQIPVRQAIPATVAAGAAEPEAQSKPPVSQEVLEAATLINPAQDEEPVPEQGDQATRMFQKARSTVADIRLTSMPLSDAGSDTGLTRVGAILGTPLYMSPEQCRGEHLDARSDIYSIGVIAYQMLTGSTPFTGETTTIITAHKERQPVPAQELNKKLPKRVSRAVMSALEKDRTARPQTAAAFASAMRANADGLGTLYRRAFALYSEYFPQFLKLSFLAHIPLIVITLGLASLLLFQPRLPKIAFAISFGLMGLLQIPATLFAAWMISAVTSVIVSQLAVAPLKPVDLRTGFDVLRRRLRPFIRTGLRVFFKILLGWILLVVPGFIMTIRYMLWAPVVLLENLQGKAALKRARQLASRSWLMVIFICVVQLLTPSLMNFLMARLIGISRGVQVGHRVRVTAQLTSLTTIFIMPLMSIVPALLYLKMRQLGGETLTEVMAQLQVLDEAKSDWQQRMRSRLTVTPQTRTPTH